MLDGTIDFSALALVSFLLASAIGALGMTRASLMAFAVTFVASVTGYAVDQRQDNANLAAIQAGIDPDSITFTSSAELTSGVAIVSCGSVDDASCPAAGN